MVSRTSLTGSWSPGLPLLNQPTLPVTMVSYPTGPYMSRPKIQDVLTSTGQRIQVDASNRKSLGPSSVTRFRSATDLHAASHLDVAMLEPPRAFHELASIALPSSSQSPNTKLVASLDKSFLEPNHPSNLSNSSAGTCGSDIGYASTTSSEHANDPGALSESTSSSTEIRRIMMTNSNSIEILKVAERERDKVASARTARYAEVRTSHYPEANKRRPCRSVSPTPSPKESAVPVPTKLCSGLAMSPRVPTQHSMLTMPESRRRREHIEVFEEDDLLSQPDQLDKIYNSTYNPPINDELASKVSDALRDAEFARKRATAALSKYTGSCSLRESHLPPQTPRYAIPSIWESGEVHGDLISWFADELGVSKGAAADIGEGLIQTCRDRPVIPRTPRIQPRTSTSSSPDAHEVEPRPFASVLAAQPPVVSDDSFAPEPRMLQAIEILHTVKNSSTIEEVSL